MSYSTAPPAASHCLILILATIALACGAVAFGTSPYSLEVGPRTTVFEGPLLPNGRVDYVAALNEQISEGVTPENNAVVPLTRALGPKAVYDDVREEYFQLLGIPQPPNDGAYLIDSSTWLFERYLDWQVPIPIREQFYEAQKRPWSRNEFPDVAAWYDDHASLIPFIVGASEQPQSYSPLVATDGEPRLMGALSDALLGGARKCNQLLLTRAMLRLHNSDLPGAWADLLACHRLARLAGNRGTASTIISNLVFAGMSVAACEASQRFAADEHLSSREAYACLAALEDLRPLPSMAAAIDVAERYQDLDLIQSLVSDYVLEDFFPSELRDICRLPLDWNIVTRAMNEHYDQVVAAASLPTFRERTERIRDLARQLQSVIADITARGEPSNSRRDRSQQAADMFFGIKIGVVDVLFKRDPDNPSFVGWCIAETEAEAHLQILRIAFMLSAYRSDHGAYPDTLNALAPDYFAEVPLDPFSDESFHYQRTDAGYRIYSVGGNLIDDEGHSRWTGPHPSSDDVALEVPIPDPTE